ncbi:hypothetical protein BDW02DRAFT_155077 [Decorospora gaudefroyi]|uniref:Uncharacterized protein n=1 Tax=Decorospora gaudefroyi TaxID=184978 RepID=A0A6A5KLW7_9PLEO|nr:hypothetical protein BDW02DRAFT_155077 [Decorospora gaudefroyi]
MAFLRNISDRIWNYVSPRKTVQRRDKPYAFKKPAIPTRAAKLHKDIATPLTTEMSPESRVQAWDPRASSPQSDIDATLLPPSPPTSAMQSEDFEGDTLLPDSPTAHRDAKEASSADDWDANEETMVVDDGTYMVQQKKISAEEERRRRDQQGLELREAGWSEDAIFLFQKLSMRGFEPILPLGWLRDFDTVPEDLFTANLDKAFLRPTFGTDYSAQYALNKLFELGGIVRDAWHTHASRTPAFQIGKAVKKYARWAMKDGQVDHLWAQLPLFQTVTFSRHVHPSVGEQRMIEKLGHLYELWHEALQIDEAQDRGDSVVPEVPTLYGITASHSVLAFVSYAPPTEEKDVPQLRLIAMFDFQKEGYDVWNSIAIAIFVVHCRNRMVQLKDCLPDPQLSTESDDPDL